MNRLRRAYSDQSLFLGSGWSEKVIPSRTARDYLRNGVNGCQGTPWNEERLVASVIWS